MAEGFGDRVIFRELFPVGLTVLDSIEEVTDKGTLSASQVAARGEVEALIRNLRLPTRNAQLPHMEARHLWFEETQAFYEELIAKGATE
jgi:chromosome partitioning protein